MPSTKRSIWAVTLLLLLAGWNARAEKKPKKPPPPTPLEEYVAAAKSLGAENEPSPGSLYVARGRYGDLSRDLRAAEVGDLVTILVNDRANAVNRGATTGSRSSSARAGITSLAGPRRAPGLTDLANLSGSSELEGQGSTSRSNTLTTTLSARVVDVLPNGYLVVEGTKDVQANSEKQRVTIRGVIRWNDVTPRNTIASDRVAQMEIRIDGRGVVGDQLRRPNFLYRLLLGLLPF